MKFLKITPIRQYRIFRSFNWPAALPEFARYNVVYGWNGSGKTTLSLAFRSLEQRQDIAADELEFIFDGGSIKGNQLSSDRPRPSLRVFNRAYVDETVFRSGRPGVPSIFFVAKGSKDKQRRIEEISTLLTGADGKSGLLGRIAVAQRDQKKASAAFDAFLIAKAAEVKEVLRSSGASRFNNYHKGNFKDGIERLIAKGAGAVSSARLDERALREAHLKKDASPKLPITLNALPKVDSADLIKQVELALSSTVVSEALETLTKNPAVEQWIRLGLPLHNIASGKSPADKCFFCEQRLSAARVAELNGHFNDSYQQLLRRLEELQNKLLNLSIILGNITLPSSTEFSLHLQEVYTPAREAYEQLSNEQATVVRALDAAIREKIKRPFEALSLGDFLTSTPPDDRLAWDETERIENLVSAHNASVNEFGGNVTAARDAIEAHIFAGAAGEYLRLKDAPAAYEDEIGSLITQSKQLEAERDAIDKSIREDLIPADELSKELASFLGREELKFMVVGSGYSIMRGDRQADHLSEGEKTAIAFLYFLKSLQDTSFDLAKGVVVIDDPISSLDANSLFCAFAYMSKRTIGASQLILLTHNFLFLKQVKDWLKHLKSAKETVGHYMIENYQTPDGRAARIVQMDPLLRDHQSEYHYLFRKVLQGSQQEMGLALEHYYGLPNIARRLLEVFLAFRFPAERSFKSRLERTKLDPAMLARVRRFVHTYSHDEGDAEEIDATLLAEAPVILRAVLDLIESEDGSHFDQMQSLCA